MRWCQMSKSKTYKRSELENNPDHYHVIQYQKVFQGPWLVFPRIYKPTEMSEANNMKDKLDGRLVHGTLEVLKGLVGPGWMTHD
jgi:hypothetical protein